MKSTPLIAFCASLLLFTNCGKKTDAPKADVHPAIEKTADASPEGGTRYVFTPASQLNFIGSKVNSSNAGGFLKFSGYFTLKDGAPLGNDHKVIIDMNSVWADDAKLAEHLKTADFFDVEKFPEASFEVTGVDGEKDAVGEDGKPEKQGNLSGNLTLHGVTKNIRFAASLREEGKRLKINARFALNRQDFGISYPGMADDLIRDDVIIELKLEATPEG